MEHPLVRFGPSAAFGALNMGLQVSGYTNVPLAVTLWVVAALFLIWPAAYYFKQLGSIRFSWPVTFGLERIALLEFVKEAGRRGWDTSGKTNLEILDLLDGLRQSAIDGDIRFWGRPNRNSAESLARNEPLHEIDRDHWKDFEIPASDAVSATDNFQTFSYNLRQSGDRRIGGYRDIHLDGKAAKRWLRKSAAAWKGRRDARQG